MLILALETSGPTASVALMKEGELLVEYAMHHTRTHSETVLPMAERAMREMQIAPSMLDAIAVNKGPGSFTGVRIGICTGNAMASALHIPLYGVDSLRALYQNACCDSGSVCAMIDARNHSAYMALFKDGEQIGEACACDVEEYIAKLPPDVLFIGDGAAAYRPGIEANVKGARFAAASFSLSKASALCEIAYGLSRSGDEGASMVEPLYMRPSQAERMFQLRKEQEGKEHGA
ncbi:tRNA (adenosine(37)-N6)-threonylcarbamoyltransferase complex dimerization subunit type 1 TsaB [Christensenellaceae bacterium OttesenSCG-928-M15]|nr:tRNA (adenosine(37)-N6)-threonylcarbamoyltransferase complex dimerization subunit type 1 TsaB [Christensenellaceae bacterium OttesenSCG-928-M15]